jgi:hypothetical protein
VAREQGDVWSRLRVGLTHRRFDREGGDLVDTALADAVAAYGDTTLPDVVAARELMAAEGADVRPG